MKLFRLKVPKFQSSVENNQDEANRAVEASRKNLKRTLARRSEIEDLTESLAELRRRNHFAELIRDLVIGEER